MNKYKAQSRQAQRERKLWKKCVSKHRYETEAAAFQKGQDSYHCPHCGGWHRTGSLATLVAKAKGRH